MNLLEAKSLNQLLVVGPIVGHHEGGRGVEAFDEISNFVIERWIAGATNIIHPFTLQITAGFREQRISRILIVDTIEETEETSFLVVAFVVAVIDNRDDSSDRFAVLLYKEGTALCIFVERMRAKADQFLLIEPDRGDPIGVPLVQSPKQLHKFTTLTLVFNSNNLINGTHG